MKLHYKDKISICSKHTDSSIFNITTEDFDKNTNIMIDCLDMSGYPQAITYNDRLF